MKKIALLIILLFIYNFSFAELNKYVKADISSSLPSSKPVKRTKKIYSAFTDIKAQYTTIDTLKSDLFIYDYEQKELKDLEIKDIAYIKYDHNCYVCCESSGSCEDDVGNYILYTAKIDNLTNKSIRINLFVQYIDENLTEIVNREVVCVLAPYEVSDVNVFLKNIYDNKIKYVNAKLFKFDYDAKIKELKEILDYKLKINKPK